MNSLPEYVDINEGCVEITPELWDKIKSLYLLVYRGPNADLELENSLEGYKVLSKNGKVQPGRYVRYMSRGIIGTELRTGGWVTKCTSKTVYLEDGRRQWQVQRCDVYVFVKDDDHNTDMKYRNSLSNAAAAVSNKFQMVEPQAHVQAPPPVQNHQRAETPKRISTIARFV